jgi:hypothetical protein
MKESLQMNRIISASLVALSIFCAPLMASAAEAPDATIEFTGGTVAAGVGYSWAKGTLQYEGKSYPVDLKGLSVAAIGAGSVKASGDVYHLAKLDDFNGNYTAVSAGVTVAGGGQATAMENQNGVVIKLRSTTQGLQFNLSVEGVALKLKN